MDTIEMNFTCIIFTLELAVVRKTYILGKIVVSFL